MSAFTHELRSGWALLLLIPIAAGCARAEAAEKPVTIETHSAATIEVSERAVPSTLKVTGTLEANRESEVAADVAGRVVATNIERGRFVQRGAALAELDARGAALGQRAASAETAAARARDANAALECERTERLYSQNVVSRAELDRARANCEASRSSTDAAVARQRLAAKAIGDASIRAPFAGMVVDRAVEIGEYVNPGRRIATIVEINPLRLTLTVPEAGAGAVHEGGKVEFSVRAFGGERFSGNVRFVGPVLRRATHDLVVEALVENAGGRLRPGMFAEADIVVGERKLALVPKSAIIGEGQSTRAFVVAGGIVEERVVLSGDAFGDSLGILMGLRPGERVVAHPTEEIRDGVHVR